jgi:hypothetical protein
LKEKNNMKLKGSFNIAEKATDMNTLSNGKDMDLTKIHGNLKRTYLTPRRYSKNIRRCIK